MTFTPQHIFMTGASGYIGSRITIFAIASGYTVTGLSRSESSDEKLHNLGATPVRGDLKRFEVLKQESAKADIVMHLADSLADDYGAEYSEVVKTDKAAIDAITSGLANSNKIFIVTSGSLVTAPSPTGNETNETSPLSENPLNDRISSETYALAQASKGLRVTTVRLAPYVYGRGGSGVKLFMGMAAAACEVVYIDEGTNRISTVHVDDAARLYLLIAKAGKSGIFNATGEMDVTTRQLSEAMGKALDLPVKSKSLEEVVKEKGPFFAGFLSAENRASSKKARDDLGWVPWEKGILFEIEKGSYVDVAKGLR